MKIRLTLFVTIVLLLPPLAILLSGQEWPQANLIDGDFALPALFSGIALLAYTYLLDTLSFRRNGSSLLRTQIHYVKWLSITGALLCSLLSYLNIFSPLWITPLTPASEILLAAFFGGILLPAVLVTRLWLSGFHALLRNLKHAFALPPAQAEVVVAPLLLATAIGFLGGTLWPMQLAWLLWLAPLLLLTSLQLLWHESSVFSSLKNGDWSRVILGIASGMLVGGGTLICYKISGGALYTESETLLFILLPSAFGLMCLQLGDVIAENWRGKKLAQAPKKKPFPIPVIAKKD